jgi:hypothetical protein
MIRARIRKTHCQGWSAHLVNGGTILRSFYHPQHAVCLAWATEWLERIDTVRRVDPTNGWNLT